MRTKDLKTVEQEQALFRGLRVSVIAERLDCSVQHVLDLIDAHQLAAIDIGTGKRKEYRVHVTEFERFIRDRTAA